MNGKAVNGRSVDEVLKDLVGDEGHALEISLRAADEAKSQVRRFTLYICRAFLQWRETKKKSSHSGRFTQVVKLVRAAVPGSNGSGSSSSAARGNSVGPVSFGFASITSFSHPDGAHLTPPHSF